MERGTVTYPAPAPQRVTSMSAAAAVTFLICAGAYLGLFALMWVPVYLGNEGWLFLFPIFVLAWMPIELGVICAMVLGVVSLVRRPGRVERSRGWLATIGGVAMVCLSFPLLWFGNLPQVLISDAQ